MITSSTKSVNVSRTALLEKLIANLAEHKKDYQEAILGFKVKLLVDLQQAIIDVNASEPEGLKDLESVSFAGPISYADEYNEIIEMMKMSVDENITLDNRSFQQYVMNKWTWSDHFNNSTKIYKSYAVAAKLI